MGAIVIYATEKRVGGFLCIMGGGCFSLYKEKKKRGASRKPFSFFGEGIALSHEDARHKLRRQIEGRPPEKNH